MSRENTQVPRGGDASVSDRRIAERIEQLIAEQLGCGAVSVEVEQGRVTLAGTVPELHQKDALAHLCGGVEGVQQVDNRIAVRGVC